MEAEDEAVPEPEPEQDSEEKQKERRKADAQQAKEQGNAAYKARKFDEAISHYDKAYELYDEDISFLTNRSATACLSNDYTWQQCGSETSVGHLHFLVPVISTQLLGVQCHAEPGHAATCTVPPRTNCAAVHPLPFNW